MMGAMPDITMPPEAANMPDPGDDLIARVVGGPDKTWFFGTGRESVKEIERTLAIAGRTLDSFDAMLDFGCGCGRVLLWLEDVAKAGTEVHGSDIDPEAIAWADENIPYATVTVNDHLPPTPYADGTFDLVVNHSVFTHIDEQRQDAWLTELQRIVRPDGLLILSTHGEVALEAGGFPIREQLEDEGIVFIDKLFDEDFALPDWYQNTYHAPWYVFEHWGTWFEILGYVPGGALGVQDHILLRRRRDDEPARRPLAARPRRAVDSSEAAVPAPLPDVAAAREAASAAPSKFGPVGGLARRAVLRAVRPYSAHQDQFDAAAARRIADLEARVAQLENRR
jgi:SAM-dependent methyltransferase